MTKSPKKKYVPKPMLALDSIRMWGVLFFLVAMIPVSFFGGGLSSRESSPVEIARPENKTQTIQTGRRPGVILVFEDNVMVKRVRPVDGEEYFLYKKILEMGQNNPWKQITMTSVAGLATAFSLLVLVPWAALRQARASSIAKFRQDWIRDLREILVSFLYEVDKARSLSSDYRRTHANVPAKVLSNDPEGVEEWKAYKAKRRLRIEELQREIETSRERIQSIRDKFLLHMNPDGKDHKMWIGHMGRMVNSIAQKDAYMNPTEESNYRRVRRSFVLYSRIQLKREWEVTKRFQ